ncbi:hypothetical protein [Novipirellula maiorica]|nr:hypothetical protein [Rhodopirellula maiorica]
MYRAISSFVWAFLAGRYAEHFLTEPPEAFGWFSGVVALIFGLFLCCRSAWVTQLLFRIDRPLDTESTDAPPRRLMPFSVDDRLEFDADSHIEKSDEP